MTKEEFLNKERDNFNKILELKSEAQKLDCNYRKELMERNGYKVGDVLTYEINGRTEKGMVYSVDRMYGDDTFYLRFKKVKKDGTMSLVDNDAMSYRDKFKLKQL